MACLLCQKQKKPGAAAEVENLFWSGVFELQFLDARKIDAEPTLHVRVFRVTRIGTGVATLDFAQSIEVDLCQERADVVGFGRFHKALAQSINAGANPEKKQQVGQAHWRGGSSSPSSIKRAWRSRSSHLASVRNTATTVASRRRHPSMTPLGNYCVIAA